MNFFYENKNKCKDNFLREKKVTLTKNLHFFKMFFFKTPFNKRKTFFSCVKLSEKKNVHLQNNFFPHVLNMNEWGEMVENSLFLKSFQHIKKENVT